MSGKVFISGALTGLDNPDEVKATYEQLAQTCEDLGAAAYRPWCNTDPVAHPEVPPAEVYRIDYHYVSTANLVIACVDRPSLGTGQEIEIARQNGVPVILLCTLGKPLSRMTRGSPNIFGEVRYNHLEQALEQIRAMINNNPQLSSRIRR